LTRTFNVFNRLIIQIEATETGWQAFYLGNEGKKRPAPDTHIPSDIAGDQLAEYLSDLFHEYATVKNSYVSEIVNS
jgi:hypothetical protein